MEGCLKKRGKTKFGMRPHFVTPAPRKPPPPITAIHQYVTILLDNLVGELNPEQRDCLEITLRNVEQLRAMIGDLRKWLGEGRSRADGVSLKTTRPRQEPSSHPCSGTCPAIPRLEPPTRRPDL